MSRDIAAAIRSEPTQPAESLNHLLERQIAEARGRAGELDVETFATRMFADTDNADMTYRLRAMRAISARYSTNDFVGNPNVLTWLLGRTPTTFEDWVRTEFFRPAPVNDD